MVYLLLTALISAILNIALIEKINSSRAEGPVVRPLPPPKHIRLFTFGYNEVVADFLWLRLIQDFDYCEGRARGTRDDQLWDEAAKRLEEAADKVNGILTVELPPPRCERGWVYQMLVSIMDISPRFLIAYRTGPTMLSVLVDDRLGAADLFERGVKAFPQEWVIAYRAGYHFLYELQDPVRAAEYLRIAGERGAPSFVISLASRLLTRSGQLELAYTTLAEFNEGLAPGPQKIEVEKRLNKIKEALERSRDSNKNRQEN